MLAWNAVGRTAAPPLAMLAPPETPLEPETPLDTTPFGRVLAEQQGAYARARVDRRARRHRLAQTAPREPPAHPALQHRLWFG